MTIGQLAGETLQRSENNPLTIKKIEGENNSGAVTPSPPTSSANMNSMLEGFPSSSSDQHSNDLDYAEDPASLSSNEALTETQNVVSRTLSCDNTDEALLGGAENSSQESPGLRAPVERITGSILSEGESDQGAASLINNAGVQSFDSDPGQEEYISDEQNSDPLNGGANTDMQLLTKAPYLADESRKEHSVPSETQQPLSTESGDKRIIGHNNTSEKLGLASAFDNQTTTSMPAATMPVAAPPPPPKQSPMVIDLLDDDAEVVVTPVVPKPPPPSSVGNGAQSSATDRLKATVLRKPAELTTAHKRPRLSADPLRPNPTALASYHGRNSHKPSWMQKAAAPKTSHAIHAGSTIPGTTARTSAPLPLPSGARASSAPPPSAMHASVQLNTPMPFPYPPGFQPTWKQLLPPPPKPTAKKERRAFQLSLLNVTEFTITGLPTSFEGPPTPVSGLRASIKSISREYGKAVYDRDAKGGGKWRIPLGAYHAFAAYLDQDPMTKVHGIPQHQLQVAFLERQRQERGYPSADKLIELGLPQGLANALAPFQRGGVDFVHSKGGRALIADDMGLGKTIQGVASMAMYRKEWPLLVLCPSSARYHWEHEFQNWLGVNSNVNKPKDGEEDDPVVNADMLLEDSQINVLGSSKEAFFPSESTRVVICSYGLVSVLAQSGKLQPGMFPCAIVDESHMLKNKASKRTTCLLPVLTATKRCVLLSGTPALARPAELWPQLCIVGTEQHGWWDNEDEFLDRYVKRADTQSRAELHAMLTGTVMIRRLKVDILKTMPRKLREKADLSILTDEQRQEFKDLLADLRRGKGALGKLARQEHESARSRPEETIDEAYAASVETTKEAPVPSSNGQPILRDPEGFQRATAELNAKIARDFHEGQALITQNIAQHAYHLTPEQREGAVLNLQGQLRSKLEAAHNHGMREIHLRYGNPNAESSCGVDSEAESEQRKRNVLSKLYELTGNVKIPLIVDLLKRWLNDPTKGKLCIFAHHISVLDAIATQAGLSNDANCGKNFIRIDGATSPKLRQKQIKAFQNDPSTRVALLGITAAGVAVTLTASSTVWFAELFWTPAIMIQAEDRCHRIGQNSQVKCMYFVARGTIDDVLWRLIEKKFSDLGEFVEGKEKLKLVVDKTYRRLKELHDMFHDGKFEETDDYDLLLGDTIDDEDVLQLDADFAHEIEVFGEEECKMLQAVDNEEESSDDTNAALSQKIPATVSSQRQEAGTGRSEEDAIALSDDEGDEGPLAVDTPPPAASAMETQAAGDTGPQAPLAPTAINQEARTDYRAYRIFLKGPKLGLEMAMYNSRVVVSRVMESRLRIHGEEGKPAVGDILTAFNGHLVPAVRDLKQVLHAIRHCLTQGPVDFVFAESPSFGSFYCNYIAEERRKRLAIRRAQMHQQRVATSHQDVIEIDD